MGKGEEDNIVGKRKIRSTQFRIRKEDVKSRDDLTDMRTGGPHRVKTRYNRKVKHRKKWVDRDS